MKKDNVTHIPAIARMRAAETACRSAVALLDLMERAGVSTEHARDAEALRVLDDQLVRDLTTWGRVKQGSGGKS